MTDYAILTNRGEYSIFQFDNQIIRFATSDRLEKYTRVIKWDKGYIVLMAHMKINGMKHKQDKNIINCFEKEYDVEGIHYMDVYIAAE